jgi:hypothetical protein
MRIFLSYASQDREAARAIELEESDLVVFLVSPDSVDAGSYTLTELEIAEKSWTQARDAE